MRYRYVGLAVVGDNKDRTGVFFDRFPAQLMNRFSLRARNMPECDEKLQQLLAVHNQKSDEKVK